MLLQIYSPECPPWLIVKGQPTRAALSAYGTLRLEGSFQIERLSHSERSVVFRELGTLTYARVPTSTALRLMARSPIRQLRRRLTRWWATRNDPVVRA
jgi:hypothetical protein